MTDYDGPQLRQIYSAALEISEGPEREAFLLRQCAGNDDLFAQAQKLLDSSGDSNTPLTEVFGMLEGVNGELQNAMPAGDFAQSPELEAGARVGNYEIVEGVLQGLGFRPGLVRSRNAERLGQVTCDSCGGSHSSRRARGLGTCIRPPTRVAEAHRCTRKIARKTADRA